jgi:hypothetical protein
MDAAAPIAVDEQMRVEALRAAVAYFAGRTVGIVDVLHVAEAYEQWLLRDG